ncbi:hypothetical protein [Paenibacillus eucommiae]|uniref:Uncharacterized protein n=1 Tax=Paenibacillus eucommiae TaxID=1355755 RepID=A0ABS4J764_9BACL|nr:hypothetical protein [Paenibacillus eucommiae]MBP1995658.1 hypothetical protein [Paenibacillus eucommiae]
MNSTNNRIVQTWIDDQLDLYNLAKQLGDTVWQEQIVQTLYNKEQHTQKRMQQDLWRVFDSINRKMLELFGQLKESSNSYEVRVLREQVWELKLQRIEIVKKINK